MSEPLRLRLATDRLPVMLTEANGQELTYELREMSASARDQYLDQLAERMKLDATGAVCGVKKFKGLQGSLLAACLYDTEGHLVDADIIQTWPASTVSRLFTAAQRLNLLEIQPTDQEAALKKA